MLEIGGAYMAGFCCPYCNQNMSIETSTHSVYYPSFYHANNSQGTSPGIIRLEFYKCPNSDCGQVSIFSTVMYDGTNRFVPIRPISNAKQYPEYIPAQIRADYEEACAILNLSPKASATLSRRCLQGMIHDFWGIKLKNLNHEITALKEKVPADLWNALDSMRQMGNIGAHMEADVNLIVEIEPVEAYYLVQLIELLVKEWYINRHERTELFSNIIGANEKMQEQRKTN